MVMGSCFVYGSLMAPEVVQALLGRVPQQKPAVLRNYRRHSLEGHTYPGAVPAEGMCIHGAVLLGLHESEEASLDAFEVRLDAPECWRQRPRLRVPFLQKGDAYASTPVEVNVTEKDAVQARVLNKQASRELSLQTHNTVQGETRETLLKTRVYQFRRHDLLLGDWDYAVWRRVHLQVRRA